eukprot:CAMPEP_0202872422 /NCGR_PEP_ID=MMETSP1391-20130828/21179_1 /ASSEMBLY_ACC=CAM_ASM_000867 /TAXON_ID=1034604 /ORGANISM="Chlamydomonas leiostraca, Strain SAG 11-49" /LENGTH=267 /DNA_ID=CAMNT_0049553457 /DNA_START=132 /DNA_END=931 /DNA_ORIENTATION=+
MDVPPDFICPISREVMLEPVLLVETGHTYEKEALYTWWRSSGRPSCPKTGVHLSSLLVAPNWTLRGAIETWRASKAAQAGERAGAGGASTTSGAPAPSAQLASHPLHFDIDAELQQLNLDDDAAMSEPTTPAPPPPAQPGPPHGMHVPRAMAHNGPAPTITASPTGGSSPAAGVRCVPAGVALLGGGGAEGAPPGWTFFPGLDSPGGDIGLAPAPALAHLATGSVSSQQQDPPAPPSPASAQQAGAGAAEADGSSGAGGEMSGIASL